MGLTADLCDGVTALPPLGSLPQQISRVFPPLAIIRLIGNFHVPAESNNAGPILVGADFIRLDADQRILPHPLYFLSLGRKTVETLTVVDKIDRHNIGTVVGGTGQAAEPEARQ